MNIQISSQKWRYFSVFLIIVLIQGCAKISTIRVAPSEFKLSNYKRAYVYPHSDDEWQINQAINYELDDMGIRLVGVPFKNPSEKDLLVKYEFSTDWDTTKYLKSFQIELIDAQTGYIVSSTSFYSLGIWLGQRDRRLEAAFNNLREKNDLPATKQFK